MIKNVQEFKSNPIAAGEGGSMQVLIGDAPNFAMRKFIIKAGGNMPLHTNTVEHEQYVLAGSAKVILDGKELVAKKDDVIYIPAGIAHSYNVIGDEDYEFLCLIPTSTPDTITLLSC
ncbi:MAG: cupin domain-containing protein [Sulfurimonadaceae bacterium]|jgi:quercetin dioxygenase-like cupin family protein|nr:cupin domain-containing protein [Sulfurimonadaceae bacterium]